MQLRTGLWHEHEKLSHVFLAWLKSMVLLFSRNRIVQQLSKSINLNINRREMYILLMGRPCHWRELQRQLFALLLLVAAFVLMLAMMD